MVWAASISFVLGGVRLRSACPVSTPAFWTSELDRHIQWLLGVIPDCQATGRWVGVRASNTFPSGRRGGPSWAHWSHGIWTSQLGSTSCRDTTTTPGTRPLRVRHFAIWMATRSQLQDGGRIPGGLAHQDTWTGAGTSALPSRCLSRSGSDQSRD